MTATLSPAIEAYLRRLRRASRWLSVDQAAELYEQVSSHLHEALPADADAHQIAQVLADLGDPGVLTREASLGRPRRLRTRLRRVRKTTWAACALVLVALGGTAGVLLAHLVPEYTAANLRCGCGEDFYETDGVDVVNVQAGSFSAMQIDARAGRQGFAFDVYNESHVDQQILGFTPGTQPWGNQPGVYTLQVATENERVPASNTPFAKPPVTVPAGKDRDVHIEWNHLACTHDPGRTLTLDGISLRVRIGSLTRDEHIALDPIVLRSTRIC